MTYNFIKVHKEEHIFHLTLARPEKRNAFTPTMVNEIAQAIQEANADNAIKVVLLQAEGPVFCAGMDLKTFENEELDIKNPAIQNENISLGEVFTRLQKPSVVLIEGDVIAGGFLMILGCTYVFAKQDVKFRLPEISLGIFPFQVMASLLKVTTEKKILQLCLDPRPFSAEKAIELGIVDGYVDDQKYKEFLDLFKGYSIEAIKSGIKSWRQLVDVSRENQYNFLLEKLQELKNTKEVENQIFKGFNKGE